MTARHLQQRFQKCEYPVPKKRNTGQTGSHPTLCLLGWTLSWAGSPNTTHPEHFGLLIFPIVIYLEGAERDCFVCDELREEVEGEDRLQAHCQGWFCESEKLEVQGGDVCPGTNFVHDQTMECFTLLNLIKGWTELTCGWNPLRSLAARSLAVRSWKRTKEFSLVILLKVCIQYPQDKWSAMDLPGPRQELRKQRGNEQATG